MPPVTGTEEKYIHEALQSDKISGDGQFSQKCQEWFEDNLPCKKSLLTSSCTHALEIAAILADIKEGDEVILPSYTFVSSANAFVLRGATIIFVDIRPDTLNIDETKIEEAISPKTKVIVPVHYAGVACEMDTIMAIAERYSLLVIEDAAQGITSSYKGKQLGTIGHLGAMSFHETKNITSGGEGGLLIINDEQFIDRAQIIREKGTNRHQFFQGLVDKYTWVDIGSSYLMNDLSAAYLWAQLESIDIIQKQRMSSWQYYYNNLLPLTVDYPIELPSISEKSVHNAHMFYIKVENFEMRAKLLNHFKENNILAPFHYVPLHSSPAGKKWGRFHGDDIYTTSESQRLIRLPLYYELQKKQIEQVVLVLEQFFSNCKDR